MAKLAPEAVALCFLHSYAAPDHEERVEAILREVMGEVPVIASSRVHPEMREFDRASTTLFTAEVAPLMASYLARLRQGLGRGRVLVEGEGNIVFADLEGNTQARLRDAGAAFYVSRTVRTARGPPGVVWSAPG